MWINYLVCLSLLKQISTLLVEIDIEHEFC